MTPGLWLWIWVTGCSGSFTGSSAVVTLLPPRQLHQHEQIPLPSEPACVSGPRPASQAPMRTEVMDVQGLPCAPLSPSSSQALASLLGDPTSRRDTPGAWSWPQHRLSAVAQGLQPPHLVLPGPGILGAPGGALHPQDTAGHRPSTGLPTGESGSCLCAERALRSFSGHIPSC